MIAAGLIIADRRPGSRIGPLAILTGFAWFVGDFTNSDVAVVAYLAILAHGWFDPFRVGHPGLPDGRITRRIDRALAIGFVVVQAGLTIAEAYGARPIAWWDCPTCISTVDGWFAADAALNTIARIETLLLTGLSIGLLVVVAARWVSASGAARSRQTPVLLAGLVLAGGFIVTFVWQTVLPTSGRDPLGEMRTIVLAVLRVLVAVGLLIGVLRDDAARGRIADLVVRLDGLPPMPVLQASLRDALGDPSLEVYRWEPSLAAFTDATGTAARPPTAPRAPSWRSVGVLAETRDRPRSGAARRSGARLRGCRGRPARCRTRGSRRRSGPSSRRSRRRGHASSRLRTTSDGGSSGTSTMARSSAVSLQLSTPDAAPRPRPRRRSRRRRGARGRDRRSHGGHLGHPRAGPGRPPAILTEAGLGPACCLAGRPGTAAGGGDRRARSTVADKGRSDCLLLTAEASPMPSNTPGRLASTSGRGSPMTSSVSMSATTAAAVPTPRTGPG